LSNPNQNKGHGPKSGSMNPGQKPDQMKQDQGKSGKQQGDPGHGARADAHRDPSGGQSQHKGKQPDAGH